MATDDAPRKCAFAVRIDAALAENAFHAPSFRFRFVDGAKKQTPPVGAAGWTPLPDAPGAWRFEVAFPDVVVSEALAAAMDDDPVVAFVLSDQSAGTSTAASQAAPPAKTSARPTTAVGHDATAISSDAANATTTTSGRGRLIADVFELDASALFAPTCLHVEQTWVAPATHSSTERLAVHEDDNDATQSVFASKRAPKASAAVVATAQSLFARASGIRAVSIRIGVDQPLLSPALRRKLNPLTLTVGTARRLPGVAAPRDPHDALARRCRAVYALWRFFPDRRFPQSTRLVVTPGRAHGQKAEWHHTTTVLSGRCDPAELRDALRAATLSVELHDRDLLEGADRDALAKLQLKWEALHTTGIDPTLPTASAVASVASLGGSSSRHTTPRGAAAATPKPLDAFAVDEIMKHDWRALLGHASECFAFGAAVFRLDELLLRKPPTSTDDSAHDTAKPHVSLKLTADVLARKRRAKPIGAAALAEASDAEGSDAADSDRIGETPLDRLVREPGAYVASGTTLSLHAALHHVLPPPSSGPSTAASSSLPLFSRFVLLFPYGDTTTLTQLMRVLEMVNLKALPPGVSLRSYQLTPDEKRACESGALDVLTGCMVLDDELRLVVLEGLADGAMRDVHRALPRTKPQSERFRMYANDTLRFTERLYTCFDVDVKRIKLRYALPMLLQMPDIYMRTKVTEPCYAALTQLMEMRRVARLADVKELELFPTAQMLLEVESKYGESISLEDIYGRKTKKTAMSSKERHAADPATHDEADSGGADDHEEEAEEPVKRHTYTRLKAPTDATNPQFDAHKKTFQPHDYLDERRKRHTEQQRMYHEKRQHEDEALRSDPRASAPVYLYSGQKLRSQDALQEELRKKLAGDHRATYTYGPQFQSLALSLVNPDELRQTEEREARKKWTTQRGFVYPAPRPTAEYYVHKDAPSEARCEDLRAPFVDNANHPKPVSRDNNRESDPSRPEFSTLPSKDLIFGGTNGDGSVNPDYFKSVHLCGEQARKEMDEALQREQQEWERKLVVDKKQIKFLAHGNICSQPSSTGGPQSSQLDKLQDILRGPAKSKPLRIVRNATLPSGKHVPLLPPPASILSLQEYAGPVAATFASTLRQTDPSVPFLATDATTGKPKDFHFPSVSNVLTPPVKLHTTHTEIRPVPSTEKRGFLWGNHHQ